MKDIDPPLSAREPPCGGTPKTRFDWTEWLPYLARNDATETQKREHIEIL